MARKGEEMIREDKKRKEEEDKDTPETEKNKIPAKKRKLDESLKDPTTDNMTRSVGSPGETTTTITPLVTKLRP